MSTHITAVIEGTLPLGAQGTDYRVFWATCTCGALREGDGFYYTREDATQAIETHLRLSADEEGAVETLPDAMPIRHSQGDAEELQEALNAVASAKSPTAREKAVNAAHLINARTRGRLHYAILCNGSAWAREDADSVEATYLEWERTITYIADLNRRALRK